MALKITPTQKNTHTVSIALSGQLNSETASVLDQQIQKALVNGANVIVLDMADLKMITSAGVGVVMKTQTSLAKRGGELMIAILTFLSAPFRISICTPAVTRLRL